jgi:hypothetical protein
VALLVLWWYLWERAHFFWNPAHYHAASSCQRSKGKLACYTLSWIFALGEIHCWGSRLDRLWGNCYPYDLSYPMIHLVVALLWGFLWKKRPSNRITIVVPIKQETVRKRQVIQKCPLLDPLWQLVEESLLLCQSHVLFHSNKIQNMLPHETNRDWKSLLESIETRWSSLAILTIRFCWDRRQLGVPPGFDEVLLLWPSNAWTVDSHEPRQLWRLWWLRDLIEEKWKE